MRLFRFQILVQLQITINQRPQRRRYLIQRRGFDGAFQRGGQPQRILRELLVQALNPRVQPFRALLVVPALPRAQRIAADARRAAGGGDVVAVGGQRIQRRPFFFVGVPASHQHWPLSSIISQQRIPRHTPHRLALRLADGPANTWTFSGPCREVRRSITHSL